MATSTKHGLEPVPKPNDSFAHREFVLELRRSLFGLRAQALWLGMPSVAHFIEVAALGMSESAPGPPTGSDQPRN